MSLVMPQIVVWMLIPKYLNIGTGHADVIAIHAIAITVSTLTVIIIMVATMAMDRVIR